LVGSAIGRLVPPHRAVGGPPRRLRPVRGQSRRSAMLCQVAGQRCATRGCGEPAPHPSKPRSLRSGRSRLQAAASPRNAVRPGGSRLRGRSDPGFVRGDPPTPRQQRGSRRRVAPARKKSGGRSRERRLPRRAPRRVGVGAIVAGVSPSRSDEVEPVDRGHAVRECSDPETARHDRSPAQTAPEDHREDEPQER
jgi:hypothetical protein